MVARPISLECLRVAIKKEVRMDPWDLSPRTQASGSQGWEAERAFGAVSTAAFSSHWPCLHEGRADLTLSCVVLFGDICIVSPCCCDEARSAKSDFIEKGFISAHKSRWSSSCWRSQGTWSFQHLSHYDHSHEPAMNKCHCSVLLSILTLPRISCPRNS